MPKKDRSAAGGSLCVSLTPEEMEFLKMTCAQLHTSQNATARLFLAYVMHAHREDFLQWVEENVIFRGNRIIGSIKGKEEK